MRRAVAFTGPSNSGKTTLIQKVASILLDSGYKVAIVKHDPKDKARFDIEGKDSFKFFQTGAEVAVVSPNKTTYFSHQTSSIDEIVEHFKEFDFLLVEGLKTLLLPRIAIFRNRLDSDYFNYSDVLAIDDTINKDEVPSDIWTIDLNNPNEVIDWIKQNAKKV